MRVTVKKWGNSASVRIPSSVMAAARLSLDETVDDFRRSRWCCAG